MKYKLHYLLAVFALILMGTQRLVAQSEVYGAVTGGEKAGIYKYTIGSGGISNEELVKGFTFSTELNASEHISGGFLVGNRYYYMTTNHVSSGYQSNGFYYYDMDADAVIQVADYGGANQGPVAASFCYDYQTGTMYAGNNLQGGGSALQTIDLENGNIKKVADFTFDGRPSWVPEGNNFDGVMSGICMTYDGDMYGVSYWAGLYKIDKNTGACSYVGPLKGLPEDATSGMISLQYTGACDLFYDNNTDKMYLTMYQHPYYGGIGSGYGLYEIDPKTGAATYLQERTSETNYTCNSIPFSIAEASAPAKVQDITVTRGDNGALTATLAWTNPVKTYGRGGSLESIESVVIFRDGVEVNKIENTTPGAAHTWTDTNISSRGMYSYRIVCYNDAGAGDRVTISKYIGPGNPMPVTDAKVVASGENALVSWTAPTVGKLDSWIDVNDLTYDIMRLPDNVQVAESFKGTSFTDTTLPTIGKYSYAITPKTGGHTGDAVQTVAVVLGPAIQIPATIGFESLDQFNLWTVHDLNANYYKWGYTSGNYPTYVPGAYISYAYDQIAASDMLISPYIKFEAGKHYKLTFDAIPSNVKIPETLDIMFSKNTDYAQQDSVTEFNFYSDQAGQVHSLRANLPVVDKDSTYHVGFYYRSYMAANYGLLINNVNIAEDHEGYISGIVKDAAGKPIEGAQLIVNAGEFTATSDAKGKYTLSYLPEGTYTVEVKKLGYYDATSTATVTELTTTPLDITMTTLPLYTVSGTVKDVAGDPVADATVEVSGYNSYMTSTGADGKFSISGVYENANYAVTLTKNKLMTTRKSFSLAADTDLGDIVMEDNIKAPKSVEATESEDRSTVTVNWTAPANDPAWVRYDDGQPSTYVGIDGAGNNATFGIIDTTPSTLYGVQFYLGATTQVTQHYSVYVRVFGLDANGLPDGNNKLYENTYVPVTDDAWNTFNLPAAIDAPNGYYVAISHYSFAGIGIDGAGDTANYPFKQGVNCFTNDYTSGKWFFLESQSANLRHNFMMRAYAAPYTVPEDETTANTQRMPRFISSPAAEDNITLDAVPATKPAAEPATTGMSKTVQSRVRYNVYRFATTDVDNESAWKLLAEKTADKTLTDNEWKDLAAGSYYYAVKAAYTGDKLSDATLADSIGNKMSAAVTFRIKTNTPENEAFGARVFMIAGGGAHVYETVVGDDGIATFSNVWKTKYSVTVSLDGFNSVTKDYDFTSGDDFTHDIELKENCIKPYNLAIEDIPENASSKLFIWNYADMFSDSFEGHSDFAVNSPGQIGWQYIDGDGKETGAMYYYEWENQFAPMAYMVWNPRSTTPSMYDDFYSMHANTGDKCLTAWATGDGTQNDDWIITPTLHFQSDFVFSFYAKSSDYNYLESFRVLYSTTDTKPESFIILQDSTDVYSYYQKYSYNVPKEAKYVALQCCSNGKRIFFVDDIVYGLPEAVGAATGYAPAWAPAPKRISRMPALEGAYEVYLDGNKVADTDDTEYLYENLTNGKHTAGVIASYTSGKTEMSTIDFNVSYDTGISVVASSEFRMSVDGRRLTIQGEHGAVKAFAANGAAGNVTRISDSVYSLATMSAGVCIITVDTANGQKTLKVVLK